MLARIDLNRMVKDGLPDFTLTSHIDGCSGGRFRRLAVEAWARAHTLPSLCAEFRCRPRWVPKGGAALDGELLAEAADVLGVRLYPSEAESLLEDVLQEMFLGLTGIRTWPTVSRAAERIRDRGLIPPKGEGIGPQPEVALPSFEVEIDAASCGGEFEARALARELNILGADGGAALAEWRASRGAR